MASVSTTLNLFQKAGQFEELENFTDAIRLSKLTELTKVGGPFTILAPVDQAFIHMPPEIFNAVEKDSRSLNPVMQHHIIPGAFTRDELVLNKSFLTLIGDSLKPMVFDYQTFVGAAKFIQWDIPACNGVLHLIDRMLIPTALQNSAADDCRNLKQANNVQLTGGV